MKQFDKHEIGKFVPPERIVDYEAKARNVERVLRNHGFNDPRGVRRVARSLVKHGVHDLSHLFAIDGDIQSTITNWKQIGDKRASMIVGAASRYTESKKFTPEDLSQSISSRYIEPSDRRRNRTGGGANQESTEEQGERDGEAPSHRSPLNFLLNVAGRISDGRPPREALTNALVEEADQRVGTDNDTGFWKVMRKWGTDGVEDQAEQVAELLADLTQEVEWDSMERPSHPVNIKMSVSAMADMLGTSEEHLRSLVRARQHYEGYPLPDWAYFDQTGQVEHFGVPMEGVLYDPNRY